jgi:GxxExxY protein
MNVLEKETKQNIVATEVIGACIAVHREIGAGLNRITYLECIKYELEERGMDVLSDVQIPIFYKNQIVDSGLTLDLLIDECLVLWPVLVDEINENHVIQLLNQLKHANIPLGIIVNLNAKYLRGTAIRRVKNGF